MYRRRAIAKAGLRYWLQHWAQDWVLYAKEADLEYVVHVYECGCKDLGEDGRLCTVLLSRVFSAVVAQDCVGVVDLSAGGVQWCIQRPSIVWG